MIIFYVSWLVFIILLLFIMSQHRQQRKNNFLAIPIQMNQSSRSSSDFQREKSEAGSDRKKSYDSKIHQLKEKAHKSFMQVIQMEHLHQQQLEELRKQYEQRQLSSTQKIKQLQLRIQKLEKQLKLGTRHILDLSDSSFIIQNIEGINCDGDTYEKSRLEESSIQQIRQILCNKNENLEIIRQTQKELAKQLAIFNRVTENKLKSIKITQVIQKLIAISRQISEQNVTLYQTMEQYKRKDASNDLERKNFLIQLQSSKKEVKYLSEHIKRIHDDKENIQRKLNRSENCRKKLQQELKTLKKAVNQSQIQSVNSENSILSQSVHSSRRDMISFARIQGENESTIIQNQSNILNDTKSQKDQSLVVNKQQPRFQRQSLQPQPAQNILTASLRMRKPQPHVNENRQPYQAAQNSLNFFKKKRVQQHI